MTKSDDVSETPSNGNCKEGTAQNPLQAHTTGQTSIATEPNFYVSWVIS